MRQALVILLAFALAACSTDPVAQPPAADAGKPAEGLDRDKLRSQAAPQPAGNDPGAISEDQIRQALAAKHTLPAPFRLAIYFVPGPPPAPPTPHDQPHREDRSWGWMEEDRDKFLKIGDELKARNIVSGYVVLSEVEGQSMKAIRLAAARSGADAVLVVKGASDARSDLNPLAITYLLLLPALVVPGTDTDALFAANAALWDVREGSLYLSADADASATSMGTNADADLAREIRKAQSEALTRLAEKVASQMRSVAAK